MEMRSKSQKMNKNRVLHPNFRKSSNFYSSDIILREFLKRHMKEDLVLQLEPSWMETGALAATVMDGLSLLADKKPPELIKRDTYGEPIDEIRFHPSYHSLMEIAVDSGMMRVKWEPKSRKRVEGYRNRAGFAAGFLFAMAESGQYCPLCMTDGVALLIDRFCSEEDRERLLPHIWTNQFQDFYTGAMFLTEKAGGSDVGANLVEARPLGSGYYSLHGEKWFCSNVNADVIFALARIDSQIPGTRGLSIFLIEKETPQGDRNDLGIVRLKDKLGVRSMASAECLLDGTVGKLIGKDGQGFKIMAEMINLSRLYNAVAAGAAARRALIESWQFLSFRSTFGKNALDHSLVRDKLWELGSLNLANFYLIWNTIEVMDAAESGSGEAAHLLRILTPMAKRESAELGVYICRESMELMGGMGYIEDTVMPKLMRDVMVLPIWEGAGNIMLLDMFRAILKSEGLSILAKHIRDALSDIDRYRDLLLNKLDELLEHLGDITSMSQDEAELTIKQCMLPLTRLYMIALLVQEMTPENENRHQLALEWLIADFTKGNSRKTPPSKNELDALIGWEF